VGFQELKNTSFFQAFLVTRDYKMGRSRAKRLSGIHTNAHYAAALKQRIRDLIGAKQWA